MSHENGGLTKSQVSQVSTFKRPHFAQVTTQFGKKKQPTTHMTRRKIIHRSQQLNHDHRNDVINIMKKTLLMKHSTKYLNEIFQVL